MTQSSLSRILRFQKKEVDTSTVTSARTVPQVQMPKITRLGCGLMVSLSYPSPCEYVPFYGSLPFLTLRYNFIFQTIVTVYSYPPNTIPTSQPTFTTSSRIL